MYFVIFILLFVFNFITYCLLAFYYLERNELFKLYIPFEIPSNF